MQRMHWALLRLADKLGGLGLAALGLALIVLLYWPLAMQPAQQHLSALEKAAANSGHVPVMARPAEPPARVFLAGFPRPSALAAELQDVFDIAESYGLDLDEVSYKQERRIGERVERYHMDFSVEATYPETRAFLDDVLVALPYASLSQLSFTRENVKSEMVLAHVRLTLHMVR